MDLTKQNIINVAQRVFGRLGFNKTTMNDIAAAASKGRRTIYTYFKSKEDVYEAVIQNEIDGLCDKLEKELDSNIDSRLKLKHYIIRRMISIKELLNYHDALKNAFFDNKVRFFEIRERFDERERKFLRDIIEEGIENKSLKPLNIDLTIQNIMITIKAFELPYFKEAYTKDKERQLNNIIEILLYGIAN